MKINFTKKEYRALVELLEISDWVLHSHKVDEPEETEKYRGVIQKIYAYSKEMGCSDLVEYNKSLVKYVTTYEAEVNSESRKYIEEFEEDTFWEELIAKLSNRDTMRKCNVSSLQEIPRDERFKVITEVEVVWAEEMEKYGLERLGVVKT
jgi:hypothetical protein